MADEGEIVMDRDINCAGMLLRRAQRRNLLALDSALAHYGTNMAQWAVLKAMAEQPGLTGHALAARTLQSDQALGTLVTPLVTRGLVARTRTGNKLAHSLTDSGRELLAVTEATVSTTLEQRMAALDGKQIDELCGLLELIA